MPLSHRLPAPPSHEGPYLGRGDVQLPQLGFEVRVHLQLQQSLGKRAEATSATRVRPIAGDTRQGHMPQGDPRRPAPPLTWEMPDSNSSGFSPLGFTILALELNMAVC